MDSSSAGRVGQRTLASVTNLLGREAAVKLLAFIGGIVVARRLAPSAFGIFAIATFAVGIFTLFSELGLGAALIRKQGQVSKEELDALFTFQLVLITALAIVLVLAAPAAAALYHSADLVPVLRALAVAFVLTSLRTTPTVAAERSLHYAPIALADIFGQAAYWAIAIAGALAGWGVWSLVIGLIGSSLVGTIVLYAVTRYRPGVNLRWHLIRGNARFGALYQGQTITSFVKDTITPSLGGVLYGGAAVGYLTWAQQLAVAPLVLVHHVGRVSYPALSQLRSDRDAFTQVANATIAWTYRITLPAFAVLAGLAPEIIRYLYGTKWLPAEPALYALLINMILGVGTGLVMPVLYSVGRAGLALRIAVAWTVGTLALALAFYLAGVGFVGIAIAYAIGTAAAFGAGVLALRRIAPIRAVRPAAIPLLTGAAMALVLYLAGSIVVRSLWSLLLLAALAGIAGLVINVWPDRQAAWGFLRTMRARPVPNPEPGAAA